MIEITGTAGANGTRFKIQEYFYDGFPQRFLFRVFIGGIYRATKRTRKGAEGVVTEIGEMKIEKEIERP